MEALEEVYKSLAAGRVKPYQLEEIILDRVCGKDPSRWAEASEHACGLRLRWLEEKTGTRLPCVRKAMITAALPRKLTKGIEQQIGSAAVPLACAGPLAVNGEHASGEFYLPIATNEAALVAGLNRGIKAINAAGGIRTVVTRDHMTRAPVVEAPDIATAKSVAEEMKQQGALYQRMKAAAESESTVSRLLGIQPFQTGRRLHLRLAFQTGDSMGMNSATKYSANAMQALLQAHPGLKLLSLTGNMDTDKKASHINVLLGRGKAVETEVLIPAAVIRDIYDVEAADMVKLCYVKTREGSALAGSVTGFNLNVANTIAALFIATGQDAAQIVESSSAFTHAELEGGALRFGISFPCLELATTGGGTETGTAKECLSLLGCAGHGKQPGDNVRKLAEIVAAAATAQDLNLLAAQAHDYELAESHVRLARGK